ncbi:MAG: hypothetical protein JXA60_13545, partial [Candidatus Coatesbacteria bacterium]|nr:hypothetical protein [Candidatus Coatesbacteria bacterium]
ILKRSSAKIGDTIYLSGPTGWADLGLKILREEKINCPDEKHAKKAFLYPEAKIDIGKRIADLKVNSGAAIDISDGLSQDAHHLAKASKVTLLFNENQIKKMYPNYFLKESVFYGGEDYQLLITHPFPLELIKEKDEHLSSLLFPVGKVIKQEKNLVLLESNGVNKALPDKGWRHF